MTDLEKAIEEVEALVTTYADNTQYDAFRLILSSNREMREALEPFAAVLADVGDDEDDSDTYRAMTFQYRRAPAINVGHLRKARSALTTQRGG